MPAVSVIVQPLNTRPGRLWVHTAAPNSTFPVSPPPFLRPLSSGPPFRPGLPPARVALISNSRHVPTVAHFSRNFFRAVQAGGGVSDGRIIITGSIFADHVPRPGSAVYLMTKAAVAELTRGLARELGPRAITVNVIQPGPTATDTNPAYPIKLLLGGLLRQRVLTGRGSSRRSTAVSVGRLPALSRPSVWAARMRRTGL